MGAIITALIGGLCVAIPSLVTTYMNNKRNNELIKYRLEELTSMAEKHEQLAQRIAVNEQIIKEINSRIDNIIQKIE